MLNYTVNVFCLAQWKVLCQTYYNITNDDYLLLIGNTAAIVYALGRVSWGVYFDYFQKRKHQFRIGMGSLTFFMAIFTITLPIGSILPKQYTPYFALIWLPLLFFNIGANYVMMPSTIIKTFGVKYSGVIFGFLTYMEIPSAIIPMIIFKYYQNNWIIMIIILTSVGIGSFILSVTFTAQNNKKIKLKNRQKLNI